MQSTNNEQPKESVSLIEITNHPDFMATVRKIVSTYDTNLTNNYMEHVQKAISENPTKFNRSSFKMKRNIVDQFKDAGFGDFDKLCKEWSLILQKKSSLSSNLRQFIQYVMGESAQKVALIIVRERNMVELHSKAVKTPKTRASRAKVKVVEDKNNNQNQ